MIPIQRTQSFSAQVFELMKITKLLIQKLRKGVRLLRIFNGICTVDQGGISCTSSAFLDAIKLLFVILPSKLHLD